MDQLFGQGADGQGGGIVSMLLMFGVMFAVLYFVMILPQKKQQKKHMDLILSLKKGDEVILSSGIVGRIFSVEDRFITLEIGDKTKMKVVRHAVQALTGSSSALAASSEENKS